MLRLLLLRQRSLRTWYPARFRLSCIPQCPDKISEQKFNVVRRFGWSFHECASEGPRKRHSFILRYLPLICLVTFIAYQHENRFLPLHSEHRLAEHFEAIKCRPRCNWIYKDKPLSLSVLMVKVGSLYRTLGVLTEPTGPAEWHIPLQGSMWVNVQNSERLTPPSPCPAVSMTSTKHILLSTTNCFRYASSIVGS